MGSIYENRAANFLTDNNIKIINRNFRCHYGEVDLIGFDGSYYIFFEVKYRKTKKSGNPAEAVNIRKQATISRVADYYRMMTHLPDSANIRFDIIAILDDDIEWFKNAFYYIGY